MRRGPSFLAKRLARWRAIARQFSRELGASDDRTQFAVNECSRLAAGLIGGFEVES